MFGSQTTGNLKVRSTLRPQFCRRRMDILWLDA